MSAFAHAKLSDSHAKALRKAPEIYSCLSLLAFRLHGSWKLFLQDISTLEQKMEKRKDLQETWRQRQPPQGQNRIKDTQTRR